MLVGPSNGGINKPKIVTLKLTNNQFWVGAKAENSITMNLEPVIIDFD